MANLYELSKEVQLLDSQLEFVDEITRRDTIEGSLQMMAFEDKVDNVTKFIANLNGEENALDAEIRRLTDRKRTAANKATWLKEYLQTCLEVAGLEKIKVGTHTISLQRNPPALQIDDNTSIPAKYMTIIPEHLELNKADLKADLKAGKEIAGCRLVRGKSLRIR